MIIENGLVYTKDFVFEKLNIKIKDKIIVNISKDKLIPEDNEDVLDVAGKKIIPGLTDIHFHGCVGHDFCDGTIEAISEMAKYQLKNGVTSICPATMTLSKDRLVEICQAAAQFSAGSEEADLLGINLEGPFISPGKCGAQNPLYVHNPDEYFLQELIDASKGLTKLVTIAPEEEGAINCIEAMKDKITFSIGHTCAGFDDAKKAIDAGAKHLTHLYNAMPGLTHREPGVIGAAVDNDNVMAEIICDGIHIHPSAVRAAFKLFGSDRMILISDSTRACGMEDGEYELGGLPVFLKDKAVRLEDGTLAGSATNVYECMINVMNMGISEEVAIKCATYNPAKAIGILDKCGTIEVGKQSKLVIINDDKSIYSVIK